MNTKTLNEIPQLDLGECKGAVTPPPFTPIPNTNPFSKSDEFTQSDHFNKSNQFSPSNYFTNSNNFTASIAMLVPDDITTDKKKNVGMITGISVAAAAVVAGLIVLAIFLVKKKLSIPKADEDVETLDDDAVSMKNSNPIYNAKGEEDPFKEDFYKF